jgi:hypothetical protein
MADYEHILPPVFDKLPSALRSWSLGEGPSDRSALDRRGCFQSAKLAIIMSMWLQAISISIIHGVRAFQRLFCYMTWALLRTHWTVGVPLRLPDHPFIPLNRNLVTSQPAHLTYMPCTTTTVLLSCNICNVIEFNPTSPTSSAALHGPYTGLDHKWLVHFSNSNLFLTTISYFHLIKDTTALHCAALYSTIHGASHSSGASGHLDPLCMSSPQSSCSSV